MTHVFVWTLSDIVGLALVALLLLVVGAVLALDKLDSWQRKRKKVSRG